MYQQTAGTAEGGEMLLKPTSADEANKPLGPNDMPSSQVIPGVQQDDGRPINDNPLKNAIPIDSMAPAHSDDSDFFEDK
jgi:hypothetical protein